MLDPEIRQEGEDGPSDRILRQFAATAALVSLAWALRAGVQGHLWRAVAAASVGIGLTAVGLARPRALHPAYAAAVTISKPIGVVVSLVLLVVVYYLVLTPMALVFRLMGRDELRLRRQRERQSHWDEVPDADLADYFRQS